jgi:hypothetical protein
VTTASTFTEYIMQNHFTVRGVPASLSLDGWWLNASEETANNAKIEKPPFEKSLSTHFPKIPILDVLVLVLLADFLFWQHSLGASLAVFAIAIFGVSTYNLPLRDRFLPAILVTLGVLPALEYVQFLSLVFLAGALITALIWAHRRTQRAPITATACLRLLLAIPVAGFVALVGSLPSCRKDATGSGPEALKVFARNWAFPIGGSLVFFTLLVDANPFFAQLLSVDIDVLALLNRIGFWLGVGLLIWPMAGGFKFDDRAFATPAKPKHLPNLGLNAASVLRALVMFNLLIGAQTFLDFSIFVGGGDLPEGMTYAKYAHRGAYPLVITALLAGGFAISARPFLESNPVLKPLLMLWLAQNVMLCLSAGLRLDLYIEAYGLTYLRIRALIWMAVVALGLCLTAWQILQSHANRWLILRCIALGVATLYLCCFVNFAEMIATTNIPRQQANPAYVCDLGPTAHRAISRAITDAVTDPIIDAKPEVYKERYLSALERCRPDAPTIDGWRDWGLRKWRVGA